MLVGLGINFIGLDPIKALIYAAIANAIVAPVVIFFIVRISSSHKFMGGWANKKPTAVIGWMVFALMSAAAIAAIYALF
jgi:Mn2+/Fe2+ NRAMP family transporter